MRSRFGKAWVTVAYGLGDQVDHPKPEPLTLGFCLKGTVIGTGFTNGLGKVIVSALF